MYLLRNQHLANKVIMPTSLNSMIAALSCQQDKLRSYTENFDTNYISSLKNMETQLSTFIRWVLKVTANGEYTGDAAMELLDQAWIAQKLVWFLRESQIS